MQDHRQKGRRKNAMPDNKVSHPKPAGSCVIHNIVSFLSPAVQMLRGLCLANSLPSRQYDHLSYLLIPGCSRNQVLSVFSSFSFLP